MPYYFYDWSMIIVLPGILLALFAQARVSATFRKYSAVHNARGVTAHEVARDILLRNGLNNVEVRIVGGNLTDHYDPRSNTVFLSESVYNSTSVAAIGVAAHECGHAVQHAQDYKPVIIRTALVPVTNITTRLSYLFIIGGLIMAGMSKYAHSGLTIALLGVAMFAVMAVFQLVTLPVEFNASNRAMKTLEEYNILQYDEIPQARKVLSAAALTYVAALVTTLLTILRFLVIISGRRRN
ncbi:MAG: zinc metallopeptidase [Oscillospiraceae bacterium]